MPTYVYKFIDTGETLEVQQSFTDDTLTEAVHPTTGAKLPVKKVFQPVGVTFKGDGFYKTDSRGGKKSATPSATSGDAAGGDSSSGDSSSSDSASKSAASDSSNGSSTSTSSESKKSTTETKSSTSTTASPPASSSSGSSTKSDD